MIIQKLSLTNVRAFERRDFEFKPGVNLIVGENGLGKTTILDTLCILLSQVLPRANKIRGDNLDFSRDDMRETANSLTAELKCEVPGADITYTVHKPRDKYVPKDTDEVRDNVIETPPKRTLIARDKNGHEIYKLETNKQLVLFFSVKRSLPTNARPSKRMTGGDTAAALADALSSRELRLAELADWMEVQQKLGKEQPIRLKHLAAVKRAAEAFLPNCKKLRAVAGQGSKLMVKKGEYQLDARQLSEGERGLLGIALDLARRLSQLNPTAKNPIATGEAVVLIDEIDLHLHPQWQRTIIERLTQTFPRCQFITTTHSPFVIQALGNGKLIQLGQGSDEIEPSGEGIEDIAEDIQSVRMPKRSHRDQRLAEATEEYFKLVKSKVKNTTKKFRAAEKEFREASQGFSTQPGLEAVLKFEALATEHIK